MLNKNLILLLLINFISTPLNANTHCGNSGVWLQVLGSGGPESDDGRASTSNVIWFNGKARILIDIGSGSLFRFEQSGASLNDLEVILLSHVHVDHSNDLPALIKASFFSGRKKNLSLYGPEGNQVMLSVTDYVQKLFGKDGAYKYLNSYINGNDAYTLLPHNIEITGKEERLVFANDIYKLISIPVHHGPIPSLAWRVEIGGKVIVFSGDMNNDYKTLAVLAKEADILVAHNAVPEGITGVARNLHMPPSVIGEIATKANVKKLVLSHRMNRTLGQEETSAKHIRKLYDQPIQFADDLQCFRL